MPNLVELQRQVVFSDLSDSDISELIKTLVDKRAKNNGLDKAVHPKTKSKEETVFLKCCQDNRNYSNSEDTSVRVCPHCGSVHTVKNGSNNGRQKYKCKDCGRQFSDTNGTVAFRSKLSAETWIELIGPFNSWINWQDEYIAPIKSDIRNVTAEQILPYIPEGGVDLVTSGMPCETFSTAGNTSRSFYDDRQFLFREGIRIAKIANAKMVLFENVPAITTKTVSKGSKDLIVDVLKQELKESG